MTIEAPSVVLWMPFAAPWRPHPNPDALCCDGLRAAVSFQCATHATPFDCSEQALVYNAVFDEFGIVIRNEAAQYLLISHCPFCGARLPTSQRDAWFDALEAAGFDDPNHEDVPQRYLNAAWRSPGL